MFESANTYRFTLKRAKHFVSFALCLSSVIFSQNPSNTYSDTLAVIGNKAISTTEFQKYYMDKLLRIGLTDNGDTRIKYLVTFAYILTNMKALSFW